MARAPGAGTPGASSCERSEGGNLLRPSRPGITFLLSSDLHHSWGESLVQGRLHLNDLDVEQTGMVGLVAVPVLDDALGLPPVEGRGTVVRRIRFGGRP